MKKLSRFCLAILALVMVAGCSTNEFKTFYNGLTIQDVMAAGCEIPENPAVGYLPNASPEQVCRDMFYQGYRVMGTAAWQGPDGQGDVEALAQAKAVGASKVLWSKEYSHTNSGVIPTSIWTPGGTSTTTHTGTVYSGGASGSYYGTSTTQHPGYFRRSEIAYSENIYDYQAVFFAKVALNPDRLCINADYPPDSYKRKMDTNKGILVTAIMKGGLAHKANILPGDIIMEINGHSCDYDEPSHTFFKEGKNIIKVYRDGKIINKTLTK